MKRKIIGITTGDINSIGLEVTIKALQSLRSSQSTFLIFREPRPKKVCWRPLSKNRSLVVNDLDSALTEAHSTKSKYQFIEITSQDSPAQWVATAANFCLEGKLNGMVTGPVSKKTFLDARLDSVGHTPLLKKICAAKEAYMGFLGRHFNVILLTGHIPLSEVERHLSKPLLELAVDEILRWRRDLPQEFTKKPLGIIGLNPHSGEDGIIGHFEHNILRDLIHSQKTLRGPLVPDAAFGREHWGKYSFYLALYHDQGLIPFKMIHGHSGGAHVTIGLPIVRTSVDHGTAVEMAGKGVARSESMKDAIKWCEILVKRKR